MSKFFPEHARKCDFNNHVVLYWNTQREYSPEGQKMIAVQSKGKVVFFDLSRNIEGVIECAFKENEIMDEYDKCDYWAINTQDEYCIKRDILNGEMKVEDLFGMPY